MKIGILTHYCNSTNYGGNLQAYALCKVLEEMGHQPEQLQIDHATCYQNLLNPQSRGLKRKLKNLAKPVARLLIPSYRKKWQGQKAERQRLAAAFFRFNRQLIPHSREVYTPKTVKTALSRYDAFITGSDQVWNPIWYFPPFFLDFVPSNVPKLSYAASIGQSSLPEAVGQRYRAHLQDFIGVSVREEDAVGLLRGIAPGEVRCVLDPTMLLSRQQWQAVGETPSLETPYVFCYFLGNDPVCRRLAAEYAKTQGLTLVTIPNATGQQNSNDKDFGDVRLADPSPEAFLGLIEGAAFVFTDSFHATVFSLIFGRQFAAFPRLGHGSSRITTLLEMFRAADRFCGDEAKQTLSHVQTLAPLPADALPETFTQAQYSSRAWLETTLQKAKEMLQ